MEPKEEQPAPQAREGQYLVRVRKGNWEVEVSAPDKNFVLAQLEKWVKDFNSKEEVTDTQANVAVVEKQPTPNQIHQAHNNLQKSMTLPEFIEGAKFASNLDKVLTFGYWIEIEKDQQLFTNEDILTSFKEVGEKPPANLKRDLANLKSKGLLMAPQKNQDGFLTYQVSNKGMKQVKTLLGLT